MNKFVLLMVFALLGCSGANTHKQDEALGVSVVNNQFGENWAFSVEYGMIECKPGQQVIFTTPAGESYALNGVANKNYPRINPVWIDNQNIPGTKVSLSPFIEIGLKQCK
ncbi:DUF2511 domain-containing protein [Acinetobacter sp. WZC-1]|uniref:DUF2511 domain-containing protein n=1 Tax=Acinetobacter sp. WZC-1 TaxID=3459034 RepID=UPI00403E1639